MSEEKKNAEQPSPALGEKLMKTRSIMLTGEITKESADQVIRNLLVMDSEGNDPITIYINSPGGDVDGGFAIYDMIRFISSPVRTVGIGLVASAAVIVLLAAEKEHRYGFANSTYLIHQPMTEMRGVAADIEIHAQNMEHCRQMTDSIIAQACGRSIEEVHRDTERLISRVITTKDELK